MTYKAMAYILLLACLAGGVWALWGQHWFRGGGLFAPCEG